MISTEEKLKESEERFKALFKSSPVPTYAWQKVGDSFELIDFNNAAEEITQDAIKNFLGSKASDMYKDHPYILEKLNRCAKEKINITHEMKYKMQSLKDEKDLILKYVFVPPDLVLVHTEDITERKVAEEKLKESGEKYRKLFNNAPFAILLINIEGIILDCNNATETITGYNKEELIGNNFKSFNFYVDMKLADLEGRQIQTSSGNVPKPREVLLHRKDSSQFWGRSHIEFIQMREKTYIQAIIHDISEQKQSTIKLHDSEFRLKERVKELNFLFEISKVAEDQNLSINEIINGIVNLIPYAWQFPNITRTRIIYDGNEFESANFKESKWTISTHVDINEKSIDIDIFYQEDKPFLQEEENLLVEIGTRLKTIIEKKNSEIDLNIEKQFTEDILNSSTDTIFVFNPETGEAIRWNSVFNKVTGYTDQEISSMKAPNSYYSEEDLKHAADTTKKVKEGGSATVEMSLITKNGKSIPFEYSATLIKDKEGNLLIVSIGRDMTERKKAEQKLKESEEKFRSIAEQSFMGIIVIQDGLFKYFNERTTEVNGYPADEIKNWKPNEFAKILHPEDREFVMEQARKKQTGNPDIINQYSFRIIQKDGEVRWLDIFSKTINYEGKPADLTMTVDTTDRIKAEQKLRESQRRYQTLASVSPVGIFNTDPDGNCLYVNERWIEIAGISFNDALEEGWNKAIHLDDREQIFNDWYTAIKNKKNFKSEYRLKRPDGKVTWVIGQALPIREETGEVQGYVGTITDINELKEAEVRLKKSEDDYRVAYNKANFYKDLFTHDMNNILQIINSSAEIIGFQLGDSEKSMYIENMTKMIKSQVDRGSKLIYDVRTLTELDEQEEISTKQVNISNFLKSAINFVKKAYSDRNISIFAEELDQKYHTIANELLQDVFDNILINSVKYNENLGVEISINISKQTIEGQKYLKLEFSDNGIGVLDDRKEVIFQPGNRKLKGTKGMGIGLSLVKKILHIFGGKIWVEDKIKGDYSKGSNFIVLLHEVS